MSLIVRNPHLLDQHLIQNASHLIGADIDIVLVCLPDVPEAFDTPDRPVLCPLITGGATPTFALSVARATQHARLYVPANGPGALWLTGTEVMVTARVRAELAPVLAHVPDVFHPTARETQYRLSVIRAEVHGRMWRAVDRDPRLGQPRRVRGELGRRLGREKRLVTAILDRYRATYAALPSDCSLYGREHALIRAFATGGQLGVGEMAELLGLDGRRYTDPEGVVKRAARAAGVGIPFPPPNGPHLNFEFGDADPLAAEIRASNYLSTRCRHLPDRSQCPTCLATYHAKRRRKRPARPIAVRLDPIRL